jgi:hypothetical protein
MWLTVPVLSSGKFGQEIREVEVDRALGWPARHWKSIMYSYQNAPCFAQYREYFREFYGRDYIRLAEVLMESLEYLLKSLGVRTGIYRASELGVPGTKGERLLAICRHLGADSYLSGPSGRDYLDLPSWKAEGIQVYFHEYRHPEYRQVQGNFIPEMSIIDLLFNCGGDSLRILTESQPVYGPGAEGGP